MLPDFRVQQREYLLEISRALTSQLSLPEVLRHILEAAAKMLGGQAGLIALRDEGDRFAVRASYGIQPALLHFFGPLLTDIPSGDPEGFAIPELDRKMQMVAHAAGLGLHQVVALPMVVGSELMGVAYIFRAYGTHFTHDERRLLQSFADQAAIAVHNARLYEAVAREKRRLDAILQYSADGVMILDANRTITTFNRALARMTGWTPAEAIGQPHDAVVKWARREPGMTLAEAEAGGWPLDGGSTLYAEGDLTQPDGTTISVGITYAPLLDREGRLVNIIANVRDITKFREAEEAKSTFVSIISHELKTPVSLIKGYASTLRRDDASWDEATVQDALTVIEEEADKLSELIENLLEATRLQSGLMRLALGEVALDRLAERLVDRFAAQSDHTFVVEFPDNFPVITGDQERLRQVLSNLISNAVKYSPGGGQIAVRGEVLPDGVRVSVSDQGVGIPPDELERIFERFYRVDDALTRTTQGTGLGLFIARSVIEAHGGRIWAESTPGQGSTFIFTLPGPESK
jgi:PAS domain S-box-containing protein